MIDQSASITRNSAIDLLCKKQNRTSGQTAETEQLNRIPDTGKSTDNGTGGLYYTFNPNNYETITITLEPDAHGVMPRGKPILAAALLKG